MGDSSRPDVVFVLADNLGYGDIGCFGAGERRGMSTPNIDRAVFNIEADPREMRSLAIEATWAMRPYAEAIRLYKASLTEHPNPSAPTFTHF